MLNRHLCFKCYAEYLAKQEKQSSEPMKVFYKGKYIAMSKYLKLMEDSSTVQGACFFGKPEEQCPFVLEHTVQQ
jgi:hypothetical protein